MKLSLESIVSIYVYDLISLLTDGNNFGKNVPTGAYYHYYHVKLQLRGFVQRHERRAVRTN